MPRLAGASPRTQLPHSQHTVGADSGHEDLQSTAYATPFARGPRQPAAANRSTVIEAYVPPSVLIRLSQSLAT
jgi:hypothetical protein